MENEKKSDEKSQKKSNSISSLTIWQGLATILLVVVIVLFSQLNKPTTSSEFEKLSTEDVSSRMLDLLKAGAQDSISFEVTAVTPEYGLYRIDFTVDAGEGPQEQKTYITQDGNMLIMQSALYSDIQEQIKLIKEQGDKPDDTVADSVTEDASNDTTTEKTTDKK